MASGAPDVGAGGWLTETLRGGTASRVAESVSTGRKKRDSCAGSTTTGIRDGQMLTSRSANGRALYAGVPAAGSAVAPFRRVSDVGSSASRKQSASSRARAFSANRGFVRAVKARLDGRKVVTRSCAAACQDSPSLRGFSFGSVLLPFPCRLDRLLCPRCLKSETPLILAEHWMDVPGRCFSPSSRDQRL